MISLLIFALGVFLLAVALGWRLAQLAVQRRTRERQAAAVALTGIATRLEADTAGLMAALEKLKAAMDAEGLTITTGGGHGIEVRERLNGAKIRDELIAASLTPPKP